MSSPAATDLINLSDPTFVEEDELHVQASVLSDPDPDVVASRDIRAFDRDIDLPNLILDGKKADARLTEVIMDGDLNLTLDGASTVTLVCNDPYRTLARSGILRVGSVVNIDELKFALVHVNRSGPQITLTFEDIQVNEFRKYKKPKKAFRDNVTRAEFILSLLREVKNMAIQFICPELTQVQKIKAIPKSELEQGTLDNRGKGISLHNHKLKVQGFRATGGQIRYANTILDVGYAKNCSYKVLVSGMEAAITETALHNRTESQSDGSSAGVFQQLASSYPDIDRRNVEEAAGAYFDDAKKIAKENPNYKAWEIAAAVQRPKAKYRSRYQDWRDEAVAFVRAYGGTGESGSNTFTRIKRYAFSRGQNGKPEDTWTCIQRLAQEVNWRAFMWRGALFYMSEEDLFAQQPRMHITAGFDGVDWIDYDYDTGKATGECTVTCRFNRWIASPGTVVVVEGEGDPVDGKWLVHSLSRSWFSKQGTITLKKPSHSFLEPAPEVDQVSVNDQVGGNIDRAYAKAEAIHSKRYPYVWGGGHGPGFGPTGGPPKGYDCSGAVSAVLHAGGMLDTPEATPGLSKWGKAGKGKHMTVWVKAHDDANGQAHTFIEFHMPKKKLEHWGTGDWGKGWSGAGFNKHLHPHKGFKPRHWPGTSPKFGTDQIPPLNPVHPPMSITLPPLPALPPNVPPPPLLPTELNPSVDNPVAPDDSPFGGDF